MNLISLLLAAGAIGQTNHAGNPFGLPPIKTGTQKYFGPGRRLPKHLIGAREARRRQKRFLQAHKYWL